MLEANVASSRQKIVFWNQKNRVMNGRITARNERKCWLAKDEHPDDVLVPSGRPGGFKAIRNERVGAAGSRSQ